MLCDVTQYIVFLITNGLRVLIVLLLPNNNSLDFKFILDNTELNVVLTQMKA